MGVPGNERTRFSSERQPDKKKVGRPKNIFGALAKENNLSNEDVKKIFKNLLTSRPENINKVIEKYPTNLTIATANILAQEMRGELTGKWEPTGRKIPKTGADGKVVKDKNGNPVMIDELRPERRRSYEMVKYMLERCFGKPTQDIDVNTSGNLGIVALDPEERRKRIDELLKKARGRGKKNKE
jgi:uncharacterized protein YcgL (UPF0745 family)